MNVMTVCRTSRYGLLALAGASLVASAGAQADEGTFSPRDGVDLAESAALAWAEDARLIYIENDEPLDAAGGSPRWGYLFASESKGDYRVYSLQNGKIRVATDLGFAFDAPPLSEEWIDSGEALLAAEKKAGTEYRTIESGELRTMFLVRGVLNDDDPDAATWALVYTSPSAPPLFVVVDAMSGKVVRTWKG